MVGSFRTEISSNKINRPRVSPLHRARIRVRVRIRVRIRARVGGRETVRVEIGQARPPEPLQLTPNDSHYPIKVMFKFKVIDLQKFNYIFLNLM